MSNHRWSLAGLGCLLSLPVGAAELTGRWVNANVSRPDPTGKYWDAIEAVEVKLDAQPMVAPRPATTVTTSVRVQAVHDGKWAAFRLRWKDTEPSEAGRLGEYSDALALQFPVKTGGPRPDVAMGTKDNPVHLFHWRAQYQRDRDKGKPTMRDLYPNMMVDMYPMEFSDPGSAGTATERDRDQFSPGRAVGNPQAYAKTGVDELLSEGFSTSSVQSGNQSAGQGEWKNGEWTLVITRPLAIEAGSTLSPGAKSWVAFAAWQGGGGEVGSRKSVSLAWTALSLDAPFVKQEP